METLQSETIQLTLPKADVQMLRKLASGMGWSLLTISPRKNLE